MTFTPALATFGRWGWRRVALMLLGAQLLFWDIYALILFGLHPTDDLGAYRLPAAAPPPIALSEPAAAYAPGLTGPAVLRLPGREPVILGPARASRLLRSHAGGDAAAWSLTCLDAPCGGTAHVYAGPLDRMSRAAGWEWFQRHGLVWVVVWMGLVLGSALLVLLPLSRYARLHAIAGLFLILVGADAWLTAFGAAALPYAWFPLLRYGVEYAMLSGMALMLNGFAGWRPREAWGAAACGAGAFAVVIGTMLAGRDPVRIAPVLDAAALAVLLAYGIVVLLRLRRTAPGPAIRILAILLVGVTAMGWDLLLFSVQDGPPLRASVLAPSLLMFGILFEIAIQGRQLNREATEARSDLERQMLEQDANLLRSSGLLRHQERRLAVDAERQRMLRDMHDGLGGTLTHMLLQTREGRLTLGDVEQELQSAVDDLRNMASSIDAGQEPIDEALAVFRERMAARLADAGLAFDWRCTLPTPAPSLDARRLLNLYRLLQEGVTNALRHAGASRIALAVEAVGSDAILVLLSDDGAGFTPAGASSAPGEGRGLGNMRHRAGQMGGRLRIESAPGQGARLILTIPVQTPAPKI
ncbi:MAG: hypothetical protein LBV50_12060 [Novosphingobium sp.]|jgi:signal transduction histidine kinase|nr:hypothetical protein [Novosphingobium sp.]